MLGVAEQRNVVLLKVDLGLNQFLPVYVSEEGCEGHEEGNGGKGKVGESPELGDPLQHLEE